VFSSNPSAACACTSYPCSNIATFCTTPVCINNASQCASLPSANQLDCTNAVNGNNGIPLRYCFDQPTNPCPPNNACFNYTCSSDGPGSCDVTPVVCPVSSDVCTKSSCGTNGCVFVAKTPAELGNTCDDSNDCTIDSCVSGTGCMHVNITCSTSDKCLKPTCNPVGGCSTVQKNVSEVASICDDQSACTVDTCSNNQCVFTFNVSCPASDLCTSFVCNATTGSCDRVVTNCNDSSLCTDDSCDPFSGCIFSPITCADSKQCTRKECDQISGCKFTPDDTLCPANTTSLSYFCSTNGTCVSVKKKRKISKNFFQKKKKKTHKGCERVQ
jgi:hypothetical protein